MRLSRPAIAIDLLSFFLSLFIEGALYLVFTQIYAWLISYQQTYYNGGQFLSGPLLAWEYGWAAFPAIVLISLSIGLVLGAQKRNLARL